MLAQIFLTIILMLSYFIIFYKVGISLSKVIGRRVCITCYSVSLTWITLLLLRYLGILEINRYLISILLAQSAVGISTLSDEFLIINDVKFPQTYLKFGTILYGTFAVLIYAFISEIAGLLLVALLMYLGVLSMTPISDSLPKTTRSKELFERLKNCCG